MQTVTVTVSYKLDSNVVDVAPDPAVVDTGHVILFKRGDPNPGKMRLTFTEKQFFDTDNPLFATSGEFHQDDGPVRVKTLPYRTTYVCHILDENNTIIASSKDKGGGAVEPVKR